MIEMIERCGHVTFVAKRAEEKIWKCTLNPVTLPATPPTSVISMERPPGLKIYFGNIENSKLIFTGLKME